MFTGVIDKDGYALKIKIETKKLPTWIFPKTVIRGSSGSAAVREVGSVSDFVLEFAALFLHLCLQIFHSPIFLPLQAIASSLFKMFKNPLMKKLGSTHSTRISIFPL